MPAMKDLCHRGEENTEKNNSRKGAETQRNTNIFSFASLRLCEKQYCRPFSVTSAAKFGVYCADMAYSYSWRLTTFQQSAIILPSSLITPSQHSPLLFGHDITVSPRFLRFVQSGIGQVDEVGG